MAVDWACGEREPVANNLSVNDVRGLLADRQSARHALSLGLKLEHEIVSRDRSALPSAIPHKRGILAGWQHQGETWCVLREGPIDLRRDRVPGRADDRYRRNCESTFHLDTFLFINFLAHRYPANQHSRFRGTWRRILHESRHREMSVVRSSHVVSGFSRTNLGCNAN